ncbi:MAG: hypothetical protein MJ094_01325 [Saccharofermentans sp.]|nr:hypothetical protein [Saccharofermentans sp.]
MRNFNELSIEEKESLMQRYYEGTESVANILKSFDIQCNPSSIYKSFPPEVMPGKCKYCDTNLIRKRVPRTYSDYMKRPVECGICGHRPENHCFCDNCFKAEEEERRQHKLRIQNYYSSLDLKKIDCNELSFRDKVFMGSLNRLFMTHLEDGLEPYEKTQSALTPGDLTTKAIYTILTDLDVLVPSPDSNPNAFTDIGSYSFDKVKYKVNLTCSDGSSLFSYFSQPHFFNSAMVDNALKLWKIIAAQECLQYLNYKLRKINMPPNLSKKAMDTILLILENYSVSEFYFIVYCVIGRVAEKYEEVKYMTRAKASVYAVNQCRYFAENRLVKKRERIKYDRISDLPQSEISSYFFNVVTKLGDRGFYEVPSRSLLEEMLKSNSTDNTEDVN